MEMTNSSTGSGIGPTVKRLRVAKGWCQSDLASRLSISIPAVSKIEAGVTIVNLKRLKQIADILETSMHYFLTPDPNYISTQGKAEIEKLKQELTDKNKSITDLQAIAIKLYEDLRGKR